MTKYLSHKLLVLLLAFLPFQVMAVQEDWKEASAVIEQATERMLAMMKDETLLQEANRDQLLGEVENIVEEVIDFEHFARRVMGRYVRTATDEEIQRFADTIKSTLMRTYSLAMVGFEVRSYSISPPRAPSPEPGMQVVNVTVTSGDGQSFELLYYMLKQESGWKLVNVMVDGINLRITFRNQFADMYQRSRSIGAVIDSWEERIAGAVEEVLNGDAEG
ncbi:MlaC/ttg2D family ABC transporter substrate-binding protein [Nitrincola alkalilacustris]|uniref:MlaC/ttg2D family ABC transporter substrate-binding protein n=1 Tax=Nitrincola alkalilacustris TaxID=1571224 RepID=UPI00124F2678|nr:ABC transporter substrate-binding protein [Nitrincola alkalilacustris]